MPLYETLNGSFSIADINEKNDFEIFYYTRMLNFIYTSILFKKFPKTCNARFFITSMIENGQAVFYENEEKGLMNYRAIAIGLNGYDEPTTITCQNKIVTFNVDVDNCVFIRANPLSTPLMVYIKYFAERLSMIENTLLMNLKQQRFPVILLGSDELKKSLEIMADKYTGFEPFLIAEKAFKELEITALDTNIKYIVDKLREEKTQVWNEFYEFFGVNNVNFEKKERLLVDEVNSNNERNFLLGEVFISSIREGIERVNEKYETNIEVLLRKDELKEIIVDDLGGEINGEIHIDNKDNGGIET